MFGWRSDNGKTSRAWVLNIRTGDLQEVRPLNTHGQMHANWSADGEMVYYGRDITRCRYW